MQLLVSSSEEKISVVTPLEAWPEEGELGKRFKSVVLSFLMKSKKIGLVLSSVWFVVIVSSWSLLYLRFRLSPSSSFLSPALFLRKIRQRTQFWVGPIELWREKGIYKFSEATWCGDNRRLNRETERNKFVPEERKRADIRAWSNRFLSHEVVCLCRRQEFSLNQRFGFL